MPFDPTDPQRLCWDLLVIIPLLGYLLITMPFTVAFDYTPAVRLELVDGPFVSVPGVFFFPFSDSKGQRHERHVLLAPRPPPRLLPPQGGHAAFEIGVDLVFCLDIAVSFCTGLLLTGDDDSAEVWAHRQTASQSGTATAVANSPIPDNPGQL